MSKDVYCFTSLLQLDGCPVGKSVGCDRISGHPRHHHDQLGLDSVVGVKAKKDNSQHLSPLVPDPSLCLYPRYSASVLWMEVNEVYI